MSYRDFIKTNILDPLKMRHTSYDLYDMDFPGKAIGYDDISVSPPLRSPYLHPTVYPIPVGRFFPRSRTYTNGTRRCIRSNLYQRKHWNECLPQDSAITATDGISITWKSMVNRTNKPGTGVPISDFTASFPG
jgi:CubicO group peptidase (beta-lactamase class C family)